MFQDRPALVVRCRKKAAALPINAGQQQKLDGFLRSVTPATAARLAQAVEFDRARGGALPHDDILSALRPHLRSAGGAAERVLTAQRFVCIAFEDLLVHGRRKKQRGRVARESIAPVWSWLARQLGDGGAKALDAISLKLLSAGPDFAREEARAFHAMAAEAILAAVPDPAEPGALSRSLGDEIAADAYDMARMMQIGEEVRELQLALRRPIFSLDEDDIRAIRIVWEQVLAAKPDCAPYLAFFVMGRLQKPWEIMRLAGALSRKMDDILISRTDAGQVGELLLCDLEDCVETLRAIRPDAASAARVLGPLERFSHISTGIVRELGIKRDGAWGRRLMTARSGIAGEAERLLARAVRDITATLPMTRRTSFSLRARRMPDMTKRLDPVKAAHAIELASIVAGARPFAAAGAFAGFLADVEEQLVSQLRRYTEEMVDELHAAPEELRPEAAAFVRHATELTGILMSEDDASIVRRRAVAAVNPQPGEALVA
jgi:hypothetical protein